MAKFQPYSITHIELDKVESLQPGTGNYYIVIWCNQFVLGHVWLKNQRTSSKDFLLNEIKNAVQKTIAFYMQYNTNSNWQQLLAQGDFFQLNDELIKAIGSFKTLVLQQNNEKISVVICTRNRPKALQTCIQSILKNSDTNFELIVVDNAPDNNETKKIVEQFSSVVYVLEKRKGLDIARNTGAKTAAHNIIAYTDDDVQIPSNWISNIKTCFANPLTMAVTGLVIPAELNTEAQYIFEKDWSFNKGYTPTVFGHRYFLDAVDEGVPAWEVGAGANMAFRREVFDLAGLFDERLDVGAAGCSGDSEMWYRILAEGWNCNYYSHLYVFHQHRKSLKNLRKQLFSYMKGHVCALLIQHEKYSHAGNLKRVQKTLPAYFKNRVKQELKNIISGKFSSIITEIRGCIAGKKYYEAHKQLQQIDRTNLPEKLYDEAEINENTLVSVIIPCYNQAHYLKEAIDSVLNQIYKNVEVIVVDDGSSDKTKIVCAEYANVQYVYVERVGLPAARNIGVQFSKGNFIVFLDADDYLYPGAVELNLYFFSNNKNAAFVSGTFDKVDEKGNYIPTILAVTKSDFIYLSLLEGNYIAMEATVLYRRELFFYFHFDTQLKACEDYDLNLRISRYLPAFHHENKLAVYRMHGSNISKNINQMLQAALEVLKKQKPFLLNSEEKNAYEQGMRNWISYYS